MNQSIFKKIGVLSLLCIGLTAFALQLPSTCYGDDCQFQVEVSPYQVNIDAGGAAHYVRVLTYTWYSNTAKVFVYIDDNDYAIDDKYIEITRDSVGHLVVKIDLDAVKLAELVPYYFHYLKIALEN